MAANPNQQSGTSPQKTPRELLKEAQREQQNVVNQKRLELLEAIRELQEIGGQDDIQASLIEILKAQPEGILLPFVQQVIPDVSELMKARKELEKGGKLKQTRSGQTWLLEAVTEE